jgi:hypothetical protein
MPLQLTPTLYKFTKREFVDKASFRFGTLYDYRDMEKHGPDIGDPREGSYSGNPWPNVPLKRAKFKPKFMGRQPFEWMWAKGHSADAKKAPHLTITSQDLLIYSLSREFKFEFFKSFNADVCLEVFNYVEFFGALHNRLPYRKETICHSPCLYPPKNEFSFTKPLPALPFWKAPEYAPQAEYRLCVSVACDPLSAVIVTAPEALRFCVARDKSSYAMRENF